METNVKKLSDAELDSLIEHGISQQETVPRHGDDYVHWMNVVAAAKEEKAKRGDGTQREADKNNKVAEKIEDDKVGQNPLSTTNSVKRADDPTAKDKKEALKEKKPKSMSADKQAEAEHENVGIPGVIPQAAETTPENDKL